jgi:hypothetical protein
MIVQSAGDVLAAAEPVFLAATLCAFVRAKAHREFPAVGIYLICRLGIYAALSVILNAARLSLIDKHPAYALYYYVFWLGYLAEAGTGLLVIQEVFRHLMRPVPGLGRYGLIAFRWVTATSVLLALATAIYPAHQNRDLLVAATGGVMRCMSLLELCLLAFILVSMQSLRLSVRSREFSVALGLAMIAAAELFGSAFAFAHPTLASVANYASDIVVTLASAVWLLCFLKPELETKRDAVSVSPQLRRWNEIAGALGQPPLPIALIPSSDSFLDGVEKVVDRVLEKNMANPAQ